MIGLLFDFIIAGILATFLMVNIQFLTGFGVGRGFSILKYHFKIEGVPRKRLSYSIWKDEP